MGAGMQTKESLFINFLDWFCFVWSFLPKGISTPQELINAVLEFYQFLITVGARENIWSRPYSPRFNFSINISIMNNKVGDHCRGRAEGSLFNSYYAEV